MPPLFTIGIPTYNRAALLRAALASAASQTWEELEILVSDNGSTDDTAEVVRDSGRPVRYLRNATNLGAASNFVRLVQEASGEYFCFLQDDDLLHSDFARRAVRAFAESADVVVYMAYAALTPSPNAFYFPELYGPPFPLNWCALEGGGRFDGRVLVPLSLWMSVAIPPAVAFRTHLLRQSLPFWNSACPLYGERMILAEVGVQGTLVAEPWIAAIFRQHADQYCQVIHRTDPAAYPQQWQMLEDYLGDLVERRQLQWEAPFRALLSQVAENHRIRWLIDAQRWPRQGPLCRRATSLVLESLRDAPAFLRGSKWVNNLKDWVRDLTPPLLHRWARRALKGT